MSISKKALISAYIYLFLSSAAIAGYISEEENCDRVNLENSENCKAKKTKVVAEGEQASVSSQLAVEEAGYVE